MNKKQNFRAKLKYRFDNFMAKGTGAMVCVLAVATLLIAVVLAALVFASSGGDGDLGSSAWDILATIINAWMPYSDEGGAVYILITALAAVAGLLFASVLIGIIGSAVEDKITSLRSGNSKVMEEGHVVVLGFTPGEYDLLQELIYGIGDGNACIVVAEELERGEMESAIRENVEVPKNVRIICRSVDITGVEALSCCSIPEARFVIIGTTDDSRSLRIMLAVNELLSAEGCETQAVVGLSKTRHMIPKDVFASRIQILPTNNIMARIIAASAVQPGISDVFTELFSFQGAEFYKRDVPEAVGLSFRELTRRAEFGVPVGRLHNGELDACPAPDTVLKEGDSLVFFAENKKQFRIGAAAPAETDCGVHIEPDEIDSPVRSLIIFGYNDALPAILRELPDTIGSITLVGIPEDRREALSGGAVSFFDGALSSRDALTSFVKDAEHIILLSDYSLESEEADTETMVLLLRLRSIKKRIGAQFRITAELRKEKNRALVFSDDPTDFVIGANMASMFITQVAGRVELCPLFKSILSRDGLQIRIQDRIPEEYTARRYTVAELRCAAVETEYVLLGIVSGETGVTDLNPDPDTEVRFDAGDRMVLMG